MLANKGNRARKDKEMNESIRGIMNMHIWDSTRRDGLD